MPLRTRQTPLGNHDEQYRLLMESVTDYAIFLLDPEGRVATWNAGAERLFGYPDEEALGMPLGRLFTPEDVERGAPEQELQTAAAVGRADDDRWLVRKDGARFWANGVCTALRDGRGLRGFAKVCRDLTEQRRAEEALRESEARFRRLAESGVIGVIQRDPGGLITEANDAFLRMVGYAREELRAGKLRWDELTPAEYRAADERALDELRRSGSCPPFEKEYVRRDGGRVPVLVGIARLDDSDTSIAFVLDLTERRQLEGELRLRAGQLAEADRRKDDFLALLGHELRNPLAPIKTAVQVMRLSGPDGGEAVRSGLEVIERQVGHLTRLVDDLLDVSRIARGKVALRRGRVELARVVADAVEACGTQLTARRHKLDVSLTSEPVVLEADPTRLAQVFGNLLANAARYTPEAGHIRLTAERAGGDVVVRVVDNGVGIRPEFLPRVFDLFAQADPALTGQAGLGLGLTLVKSLVEMHGGTVSAHSEGPGRGSEFVVRLPVAAEAGAAGAVPSESNKVDAPARRVLIVDDNVDGARTLAVLLKLHGHEVRTVHEGAAALDAAADFGPDVVLLDIGLPGGLSGYDLAPRLRELPGLGGLLLVALTGYGQEEDKRRAAEAGFDAHLTKPADLPELQALLIRARAG